MIISFIKNQNGLFVPAYDSDHEKAKKFKAGEEIAFQHKKIRNIKFHRKYFSMIRMLFDNQELFKDQNTFRKYIEMKAGYFTVTKTDAGEMILPKSIAFDKLSEEDFSELYSRVLDVAFEKFGMESEEIEQFLLDYL